MQPLEDVDNIIKQNNQTLKNLKSTMKQKATVHSSLLTTK